MKTRPPEPLASRIDLVRHSPTLGALAARLESFLEPLLGDSVYIPEEKALLSRDGGVCESDGSRLLFDPLNPFHHLCPRCDRVHFGERYHRAWVWRYHIWLSERVIHLALLGAIKREVALQDRARSILELYAARYRDYPNKDNVLGPTRLFFSTYLESIWLTQLVIAALFLRSTGPGRAPNPAGFDKMVKESSQLIGSFDEGWSNRQVWNNTALMAAGLWLDGVSLSDGLGPSLSSGQTLNRRFAHGLDGPHGIRAMLVHAVTGEGLWFEGENYHFFALRGMVLAAELARSLGIDLYGVEGPHERLHDMFVAPLRTVLPDLTLPARGDSPYGVSLLQPRFAELWEIGWERTSDARLESLLAAIYSAEAPERDDFGLSEIAEQEQNRSASRLRRELLGWKALWLMKPEEPTAREVSWRAGSALLPSAGLGVIRTRSDRYVSVECGGKAGGHGHPDLLHLTIFAGRPLLMDFGTASYVSPSLQWYRSTLAHNAPADPGVGQVDRKGWCEAFDVVGGRGWCRAVAEDVLGAGRTVIRTVVVCPNFVLDVVDVEVNDGTLVDLPIHLLDLPWPALGDWRETFDLVSENDDSLGEVLEFQPTDGVTLTGRFETTILHYRERERLLVLERPGPPDDQFADGDLMPFLVRRAQGPGRWIQCYGLQPDAPATLRVNKRSILLGFEDGSTATVSVSQDKCRIVDRSGVAHKLRGSLIRPEPRPPAKRRARTVLCPILERQPSVHDWERALPQRAIVDLGPSHYRRSELPHGARGPFFARVATFVVGTKFCFAVTVVKRNLTFRRADDPDPFLDNETPDIHSDGVQCYLAAGPDDMVKPARAAGRRGVKPKAAERSTWHGFLLVPDTDSVLVRAATVEGAEGDPSRVQAAWTRTLDGYSMVVAIDVGAAVESGVRIPVNLVVNEMYPDRERRAGQLALSGGGWVYLKGDREAPSSALLAEVF